MAGQVCLPLKRVPFFFFQLRNPLTLLSHEFSSSNEITNSNESARKLILFFIFRSNLYWTINLRPVISIAFKILCSTFKTEALSFHTV